MVSLFVWVITFNLSGMGDPASSYANASIARIKMLKKKFGPKRQDTTGYWRKLHGDELRDIVRVI
jgi:hypothetical protein